MANYQIPCLPQESLDIDHGGAFVVRELNRNDSKYKARLCVGGIVTTDSGIPKNLLNVFYTSGISLNWIVIKCPIFSTR